MFDFWPTTFSGSLALTGAGGAFRLAYLDSGRPEGRGGRGGLGSRGGGMCSRLMGG